MLNLSDNQLTSLPVNFGELKALKHLQLNGNPRIGIPHDFSLDFETEIECQELCQHLRDWQSDTYLSKIVSTIENQSEIDTWMSHWPYWVKYRDFLLPLCEKYPGETSNLIKNFIKNKERVKLRNSKYTIVL